MPGQNIPTTLSYVAGCEHKRFFCLDLSSVRVDSSTPVTIKRHFDEAELTFAQDKEKERIIVLSDMYHQGWVAHGYLTHPWQPVGDRHRLDVMPMLGGLVRVRVPPGFYAVSLRFHPWPIIFASSLSWIVLAMALLIPIALWLGELIGLVVRPVRIVQPAKTPA